MNGYFNAARNMPMVDYGKFATNKKRVEKFCRTHKNDNLMNVIKKVAFETLCSHADPFGHAGEANGGEGCARSEVPKRKLYV